MTSQSTPQDLQRWSEEVARDPESLAFLPLARSYRRSGHREAALRLCLRGLEHHPTNAEAHALLARLYLETGQRERACDEWSFVLRLEPEDFEAHRGLGFFALEHGDLAAARRHLEAAAAARAEDPAVRDALSLTIARLGESGPSAQEVRAEVGEAGRPADPSHLFDPLLRDSLFEWAAVLDRQGLVLAAVPAERAGSEIEALGAMIGAVASEADRTSDRLALGGWRGALLETDASVIHLSALGDGLILLLAARRAAPPGWVLRTAARAAALARDYFGVTA